MIVLDYLRVLDNYEIVIPPFHTGHLGFIPNTFVRIGVIAPFDAEPSHCELIITPYDPSNDLAILRCTMKDGIGVVRKLVNALSSLKINIVTQESSSINHQSQHTINLLLDLSGSKLKKDKTYDWAKQKYSAYAYVFPLSDYRFLKIFERVIAFCGDCISWENHNDDFRLQLYMTPLETKHIHHSHQIKVIPANSEDTINSKNRVKIELPDDIVTNIQRYLRPSAINKRKLKYVLFSDTKERSLRIYFPKIESWDKLVHIGIHHNDIPGALSSIFDLLASAEFNIITGLLRKNTASANIWEGLLEYCGDDEVESKDLYGWVAQKLVGTDRIHYDISKYEFKIGSPLYPKKVCTPLPIVFATTSKLDISESFRFQDQLSVTLETLKKSKGNEDYDDVRIDLVNLVSTQIATQISTQDKGDFKKKIFISYPSSAKDYVKMIRSALEKDYDLDDAMKANGDYILKTVLSKIKACDFFLAIWNHEEQSSLGNGKFGASPWMPFEYGVALAEGKKTYVIKSSKLDESVWKRIDPGKNMPEFTDLTFESITLPEMKKFIENAFKPS